MKQIIYKKGLYMCGKFSDISAQLKSLCLEYRTVKEFIYVKAKYL